VVIWLSVIGLLLSSDGEVDGDDDCDDDGGGDDDDHDAEDIVKILWGWMRFRDCFSGLTMPLMMIILVMLMMG